MLGECPFTRVRVIAAVPKFEIEMSKFSIICSVRAEVLKITYKKEREH